MHIFLVHCDCVVVQKGFSVNIKVCTPKQYIHNESRFVSKTELKVFCGS